MINTPEFRQRLHEEFGLEPRHLELLMLLCDGKCLIDAAKTLGLTECSVRTYCRDMLATMEVSHQFQAVVKVYKLLLETDHATDPIRSNLAALRGTEVTQSSGGVR